ncbi:MAG: hypothetical protein ABSC76_02705 [Terracidiphilus sp.]|jgi:outer membrane biosynthesis protein TonB
MKLPGRKVAGLLPLMLLAGCFHFHKTNQNQAPPLAPPIEVTPPPIPIPLPAELPPPGATPPSKTPATQPVAQQEKPKPPVKHRKPAPAQPPPANNTQQASAGSPGVSAIGQLSSGDPADLRFQTQNSITATENGLKAINRELSDQEKKTADHIREFLKQAKAALTSGDVDGAATLAAKAKVLLGELSK